MKVPSLVGPPHAEPIPRCGAESRLPHFAQLRAEISFVWEAFFDFAAELDLNDSRYP
jgi:hypothetical protein